MVSATGMALFAEMLPLPHMKNLGSDLSMIGKIRNDDDTRTDADQATWRSHGLKINQPTTPGS